MNYLQVSREGVIMAVIYEPSAWSQYAGGFLAVDFSIDKLCYNKCGQGILFRGKLAMTKKIRLLQRYLTLTLYGIATLTITPHVDYAQNISTPEQIAKASWERTGAMLKAAIDKQGKVYEQKS